MPINEKIITTLTDDEKDVLEVFPAEDQIFFDQPDSVYIRMKYTKTGDPATEGLSFFFKSCAEQDNPNIDEKALSLMVAISWGLMALASRQSFQVYNLGIQVLQDKMINDQLQNMPEEHKKILSENTDIPSNLN